MQVHAAQERADFVMRTGNSRAETLLFCEQKLFLKSKKTNTQTQYFYRSLNISINNPETELILQPNHSILICSSLVIRVNTTALGI